MPEEMARSIARLDRIVQTAPRVLLALPLEVVSRLPEPGKWSAKEELGHLIDSALNHVQRVVRAQFEMIPAFPPYDHEAWVTVQTYQHRPWKELVKLWEALNRHLLATARRVTPARRCTIGVSEPMTLAFLFHDYVDHTQRHLAHMGVAVEELQAASAGM